MVVIYLMKQTSPFLSRFDCLLCNPDSVTKAPNQGINRIL